MRKALVTAEAFGYGPASKLHAVCRQLMLSYDFDFVGESAAHAFALANSDTYASIREIDAMRELEDVDPGEYDIAISVMDPFLPIWAHAHDVPCVYVDSLFWFWSWTEVGQEELTWAVDDVRSAPGVVGAVEALESKPMHVQQYVAHCLATINCVQNATGVSERIEAMRELTRFRRVGAIIDLSYLRPASRDLWLATAGGMINPLLPYDAAVDWLKIVAAMIEEAAESAGIDGPILLTGNPDVLASASDADSTRIRMEPLDHESMLRTMNRAIACLAPPGLTTVLECAAYGIPVLLLPEQHYGHLANFYKFTEAADGAFPHAVVSDPTDRRSGSHLKDTLAVAERLRRHATTRGAEWERMVAGVANGLRTVMRERARLVASQQAVVERLVDCYSGAEEVAACVEELVTERRGDSERSRLARAKRGA
jgi:hypothetical protein